MRIDPALLFTESTPSSADRAAAQSFLGAHIVNDQAPTEGMIELTAALQHWPAAWHFEHDGWWIGGFGEFPGTPHWSTNAEVANRIFLCKDHVGWVLQSRLFEKAVRSMRADGLTDPGIFLERLTQGFTPRQFMDRFDRANVVLGPYQRPRTSRVDGCGRNDAPEQAMLKPGESFRDRFGSLAHIAAGTSSVHGYGSSSAPDVAGQMRAYSHFMANIDLQSKQTYDALLNVLSPAAVKAAAHAGFDDLRLVSWLTMGHSERRIQALDAHPGTLGDLVLQYWRPTPSSVRSADHLLGTEVSPEEIKSRQAASRRILRLGNKGISAIAECIDQGQPWYAKAAHWLTDLHARSGMQVDEQYTQELVRGFQRIPRLPPERRPTQSALAHLGWLQPHTEDAGCLLFNKPEVSQAAMVIWLTGVLQVADLPLNDAQWAAARETLSPLMKHDVLFAQQVKHGFPITPCLSLKSVRAYRGRFQGVAQPLSLRSTDWLLSFELLSDLAHTTQDTAYWIAQAFGHANSSNVFVAMDSRWTVQQWQRAQRALHGFHEQLTRRQAASKAKDMAEIDPSKPPALWPIGTGLPVQIEVKGVSFKALTHPLTLLKEGDQMGHCVAGYAPACFAGDSRIYSVSDSLSGERATLELAWAEKRTAHASPGGRIIHPTPQLIIRQLRGPYNDSVSIHVQQAAETFLTNVRSSGGLQEWPPVEVPEAWQEEESATDEVFIEQVRRWMSQHYPQLYQQLVEQKF